MTHRCYSATPIAGEQATLDGPEAHHLLHVLRASPGLRVTLFDGSGNEYDAEVTTCGRATVELAVGPPRWVSRQPVFSLILGVPLPKGDRQRWIVEKAVELGVARLVPLHTERSVATGDKVGGKLDRYVIEASKQCGRNRLMEIVDPQTWGEWLAAPPQARRWIADATGQPIAAGDLVATDPTFAAVGPEGGLTDAELDAARAAGWTVVNLGSRILRIETAAAALAVLATVGCD